LHLFILKISWQSPNKTSGLSAKKGGFIVNFVPSLNFSSSADDVWPSLVSAALYILAHFYYILFIGVAIQRSKV